MCCCTMPQLCIMKDRGRGAANVLLYYATALHHERQREGAANVLLYYATALHHERQREGGCCCIMPQLCIMKDRGRGAANVLLYYATALHHERQREGGCKCAAVLCHSSIKLNSTP